MKASLAKHTDSVPFTSSELENKFQVKPLTAAQYEALVIKSGTSTVKLRGLVAKTVITDWDLEEELSESNKMEFGQKYAYKVMAEMTDFCLDLAVGLQKQVEDAKKD